MPEFPFGEPRHLPAFGLRDLGEQLVSNFPALLKSFPALLSLAALCRRSLLCKPRSSLLCVLDLLIVIATLLLSIDPRQRAFHEAVHIGAVLHGHLILPTDFRQKMLLVSRNELVPHVLVVITRIHLLDELAEVLVGVFEELPKEVGKTLFNQLPQPDRFALATFAQNRRTATDLVLHGLGHHEARKALGLCNQFKNPLLHVRERNLRCVLHNIYSLLCVLIIPFGKFQPKFGENFPKSIF